MTTQILLAGGYWSPQLCVSPLDPGTGHPTLLHYNLKTKGEIKKQCFLKIKKSKHFPQSSVLARNCIWFWAMMKFEDFKLTKHFCYAHVLQVLLSSQNFIHPYLWFLLYSGNAVDWQTFSLAPSWLTGFPLISAVLSLASLPRPEQSFRIHMYPLSKGTRFFFLHSVFLQLTDSLVLISYLVTSLLNLFATHVFNKVTLWFYLALGSYVCNLGDGGLNIIESADATPHCYVHKTFWW